MYSRSIANLSGFIGLAFCAAVSAQSTGVDTARANNCLACHQIEAKRVGPPFKAVAERYAEQDGAQEYLAQTIQRGGRGRWGAVPMPAQPQVGDSDAQVIAEWILSLSGDGLANID